MLAGYRSAFSTFDSVNAILKAFSDPNTSNMFSLYVYPSMVWANLKSIASLSPQNPAIATRAQDTLQCMLGIMLYYSQPSLFSSTLSIYLNDRPPNMETQAGSKDVDKLKELAQEVRNIAPPDTNVRQAVRRFQLVVGRATLIAYIALCGTALLSCLLGLGWAEWWARRKNVFVPIIGSFPAWDEWIKCEIQGRTDGGVASNEEWNRARVKGKGVVRLAERMRILLVRGRNNRGPMNEDEMGLVHGEGMV
jgi:hypothetical protein